MEIFGKSVFALLAFITSVIIGGYVFMVLWSWFISPTFHVQNLTVAQALGVSLVYDYIKTVKETKVNEDESVTEKFAKMLGIELIKGALFLGIGWIITLFL